MYARVYSVFITSYSLNFVLNTLVIQYCILVRNLMNKSLVLGIYYFGVRRSIFFHINNDFVWPLKIFADVDKFESPFSFRGHSITTWPQFCPFFDRYAMWTFLTLKVDKNKHSCSKYKIVLIKKLGSKTYYFTLLLWFCKVVKIFGW